MFCLSLTHTQRCAEGRESQQTIRKEKNNCNWNGLFPLPVVLCRSLNPKPWPILCSSLSLSLSRNFFSVCRDLWRLLGFRCSGRSTKGIRRLEICNQSLSGIYWGYRRAFSTWQLRSLKQKSLWSPRGRRGSGHERTTWWRAPMAAGFKDTSSLLSMWVHGSWASRSRKACALFREFLRWNLSFFLHGTTYWICLASERDFLLPQSTGLQPAATAASRLFDFLSDQWNSLISCSSFCSGWFLHRLLLRCL